jgi:hypothetical protein
MDSLSGLTKLVYDSTLGKKSTSSTSATSPSTSAPSANNGIDLVNISPNNVLDYIKSQAANLKSSLPGIIASSLLPGSNSANTQDPLNALMNQFVNPAQSLLSSNANLSNNQLTSLQQEVASMKNYLPGMMANSLLAPLQGTSNSLDSILQSMSSQLTNLADQVQQKIQG